MSQTTPSLNQTRTTRIPIVRERGSLLILCVTVLVIIALVGIAFLQRVRMDQFATARHERSYINLVINGILGEVSDQMEADVDKNQTDGDLLFDYPWTDHSRRDFEATQEYPNPTTRLVNGYARTGTTGADDDRWLASTAPVWSPNDGEYRWLHLTNLTGISLHLPDPLGGGASVIESLIDGDESQIGNARESDTNLAIGNGVLDGLEFQPGGYETRGTDADGDGIIDSMWQWTPVSVRRLGGRKYVMALRIVDLNSMLNVNTAGVMTLNGAPASPWAARGHSPAWVDLSRLLSRMPTAYISSADWRNELSEMINMRIKPLTDVNKIDRYNIGGAVVLEDTDSVETMWQEQGAIYGNVDRNYLMDSEMELRRFGGLNDRTLASGLEIQMGQAYGAGSQFSRALRQHPALSGDAGVIGPEGSYLDVVGSALTQEQAISRWFYGDDGTPTNNGDLVAVRSREFPAVRHMLTTASGTGVYAPRPSPGTLSSSRIKYELHRDWTGTPADINQEMNDLMDQMEPAFKRTTGNYLGLSDAQIDGLIEEYAVAIKDYSDPDSVPSVPPSGAGVYGMERLPFLREVYVQALYTDVIGDTSDRAPWDAGYDGSVGPNYVGWSPDPSDVGGETYAMAIEVGNPFNHIIYGADPNTADLITQGLEGQVEVRVYQGATQIGIWQFDATTPDIDARDSGGDADTLIIYSPPVDKLNENLTTGTHDGSDLPNDLNMPANARLLQLPDGTLTNGFTPGGAAIEVELWVQTPNGLRMYDRMELDANASLPANIDHSPSATAENQFAQASSARDSENINFVVDDGPGSTDINSVLPTSGGSYSTGVDRFGNDSKGIGIAVVAGPEFYNRLQLPLTDEPMRSLAELAWVHMFGFTDSNTFSERMSANFGIPENEHFLLLDPSDPGYTVIPNAGIPHVALLMDMFTTVSPEDDGRDNDNEDGDNNILTGASGEIYVPGTINVNTAPMHLMTLGSLMGESLDEAEKLMRTIVAYRDEPLRSNRLPSGGNHGDYWDIGAAGFDVNRARDNALSPNAHVKGFSNTRLNQPGIASLGEMLFLNPGLSTGNADNDMLKYGLDNNAALPSSNGGMDMYPDPNDSTANGPLLNQGDDNEQLIARFGMLSQAFTVRSDRYVVYGVVRGYDDQNLQNLPVETARFIAVIDRGSMVSSANDSPRVIGFVRLQ